MGAACFLLLLTDFWRAKGELQAVWSFAGWAKTGWAKAWLCLPRWLGRVGWLRTGVIVFERERFAITFATTFARGHVISTFKQRSWARPRHAMRKRPDGPRPSGCRKQLMFLRVGGQVWPDPGAQNYSRGSNLTMARDRLSPPPRARDRAFWIMNSVASRGDSMDSAEPISLGLK